MNATFNQLFSFIRCILDLLFKSVFSIPFFLFVFKTLFHFLSFISETIYTNREYAGKERKKELIVPLLSVIFNVYFAAICL